MRTKLIMLDTPIIVSDDEIKDEEPCLVDGGLGRIGVDEFYSNVKYSVKPKKIIAGIEGLPSINWNGLEEEFGWIVIEKLAINEYGSNYSANDQIHAFIDGFKKAQSLNEKKFSLEDMREAIAESWNSCEDNEGNETFTQCFNRILQSLQQPKVFDIEIEVTNNSIKILERWRTT